MGKTQQYEQKPPEIPISVTTYEVNLISNILYVALNHMQLDDHTRKMAQSFIAKLQKAALSISRQPTH
jgi:nitrate reductase cytochrome c-type subunit